MKLGISYRLHFCYSEAIVESQNEVRVRPRDDACQQVLSYQLQTNPTVTVLSKVDYWGTTVEHVGLRGPHSEFELLAQAQVETQAKLSPTVTPSIAALEDEEFRSKYFEYLGSSPHVRWRAGDVVEQLANSTVGSSALVSELVCAILAEVRTALTYTQDSTDIGITLAELLAGGVGVCQDFAHLTLGMLRCVGVPCRYVSGYFFAADDASDEAVEADLVSVQTHAWIEVALPGWGWWALDPTNGVAVGERHVVIGYGRDYNDVPPVRGVFSGAGLPSVDAQVVIAKQSAQQQQ